MESAVTNRPTRKPGQIDAIIVACVVVVYTALVGSTIPGGRFSYDEADYMYAVSRGLAANYLDRPTIPLTTFIAKGMRQGMDQGERISLSDYIRASDDIAFYRHFHPPLYFYWVILHSKLLGTSERAARWASFDCLLLAFIAIYLGCLALAKRGPRITAILASTLLLVSSANVATAREITPHNLYVVAVIVALFAMGKLVEAGTDRHWYYSLAALTAAILTMEYAVLLVPVLVVCMFVRRADLFAGRDRARVLGFAGRSIGLVLLMTMVAWPAGLFKLTLIKNYMFFAYFAVVRVGTYGVDSPAAIWWNRISQSPVEFGVIIGGVLLAIVLLVRRRAEVWLLPFAVYGILMLLTTALNRSPSPTYISSLMPVLAVIAGAALGSMLAGVRRAASVPVTAAICTALVVGRVLPGSDRAASADAPADVVVDLLGSDRALQSRVLMPNFARPTAHYYFPGLSAVVYSDTLTCAGVQPLVESTQWDGVICRGPGRDSLRQRLEQRYDVAVRRGGSSERGQELIYYRLNGAGRR